MQMPRKDRTFSDKDLIRIFNLHLTPEEQNRVLDILCGPVPPAPEEVTRLESLLRDILDFLSLLEPLIGLLSLIPGGAGARTLFASILAGVQSALVIIELLKEDS